MKKTAVKFKDYGNRILDAKDWTKLGVSEQGKTVWDDTNESTLTSDDLSPAAIEVLRKDPAFEVYEFDSEPDKKTEEKGSK